MSDNPVSASCPVPFHEYQNILLAHGGGGKLTHKLIQEIIEPHFHNDMLAPLHDGAIIPVNGQRLAFTTDSYVVHPLFFPGGDIGKLAVHGTVNDLAMCGAMPLYLSVGFIIEEGLPVETLRRVVCSMQEAAESAGVKIVTGDTKVVDRGKGDKLFINTSGIGVIDERVRISPTRVQPGDAVILSGAIGMHGVAILSVREGVEFTSPVLSDTAPLNGLVAEIIRVCPDVHLFRDPTRGGVATVLNEIASSADVGISISEETISVPAGVEGACELMGLDPLYIANEGKLMAFVPCDCAEIVLKTMKEHPLGKESTIIGKVVAEYPKMVVMRSKIGGNRIVDMLSGEQLPRIC